MAVVHKRIHFLIIMFALYLCVLSSGAWASALWAEQHTTHVDVPFVRGHWIHIHFGDRFLQRYQASFPEPPTPRRFFPPVHVRISHRSKAVLFGLSLVDVRVPTWLPVAVAAGALFSLVVTRRWVPSSSSPYSRSWPGVKANTRHVRMDTIEPCGGC